MRRQRRAVATGTKTSFNPWRVFWLVATLQCGPGIFPEHPVSIPGGFSGSLRLSLSRAATGKVLLFQSLAGFLARCDVQDWSAKNSWSWFQSLAGFLARCDIGFYFNRATTPTKVSIPGGFSGSLRLLCRAAGDFGQVLFQSLAGFLARCDCPPERRRYPGFSVSIPGGFSGSLRPDTRYHSQVPFAAFQSLAGFLARCDHGRDLRLGQDLTVSIPGGFSGSLRHAIVMGGWTAGDQFQSLAGFLARCDVLPFPWSQSCHITFQSLAGFLARCDQTTRQVAKRIKAVSIPGGFSGSLRPVAKKRTLPSRLCFNPWRVFWLVATASVALLTVTTSPFQSLAGFLARCDPMP